MDGLRNDLRHAVRALARNPGFTVVAVLTLGLGIGANTGIFSLVDATLLHPLSGLTEPDRLVSIHSTTADRPYRATNYADYVDLRRDTRTLTGLAAHASFDLSLSAGGGNARVEGTAASRNYFQVLGVDPARGRAFTDGDGAVAEVVISHRLWRRFFAGEPPVIGRDVKINSVSFTIVGVAPRGFRGTDLSADPAIWIPLDMIDRITSGFWATFDLTDYDAQRYSGRRINFLDLIGRLAPHTSIAAARAELTANARRLEERFPQTNDGVLLTVVPANVDAASLTRRDELGRFTSLLSMVAGLALLIACANLANLLLARATHRSREIAIRLALGARRARLIRQLLTESMLLALLGAGLGLVLAWWLIDLLGAMELPGGIAVGSLHSGLNPVVLGVTLATAVASALAFGLVPALQTTAGGPASALRERAAGTSRAAARLRAGLVAAQVAICVVLLIGAGLFLRSLHSGLSTDLGFASDDLLTASIDLGTQGYDEADARAFYTELLSRIESLPSVRSASLTSAPFGRRAFGVSDIELPGAEVPPGDEAVRKHLNFTAPRYARTMGLTILRGRDFEARDMLEGAPSVAIVSDAMADRYWPNQNPIGKRFRFAPSGSYFEVVGVVEDVAHEGLRGDGGIIYIYLPGAYEKVDEVSLVVRTASDPGSLAGPIREQVHALDPDLPLFDVMTMSERVASLLGPQRMGSILLACFGVLALVLTTVGIYGVVAYSVGQRTREIGIRIALGAARREVLTRFLLTGSRPAFAGLALGVLATLPLARLASAFLYGVTPTDMATYAGTAALLGGIAILAAYVPARRAASLDPAEALRDE
jgi:predicted permease